MGKVILILILQMCFSLGEVKLNEIKITQYTTSLRDTCQSQVPCPTANQEQVRTGVLPSARASVESRSKLVNVRALSAGHNDHLECLAEQKRDDHQGKFNNASIADRCL